LGLLRILNILRHHQCQYCARKNIEEIHILIKEDFVVSYEEDISYSLDSNELLLR